MPDAIDGSFKAQVNEPICVLMVEDDPTNSMVTRNYLEHLGHSVLDAQSGEEALTLLDQGGMSLVLLDISLPGIDGLTILKYLRTHADPAIAGMPVVAMSAHVFTEEVDQYLSAGMNGFLGKPFSLEDLELAIAQAFKGDEVVIAKSGQPGKTHSLRSIDTSIVKDDIDRLGLDNVEQLAELFFKSVGDFKAGLIEAMSDSDYDAMEKLAHKMGGSAGNFGLDNLCLVLATIEAEARNRSEITPSLVERLETSYAEALSALHEYLAEEKSQRDENPAAIETGIRASR